MMEHKCPKCGKIVYLHVKAKVTCKCGKKMIATEVPDKISKKSLALKPVPLRPAPRMISLFEFA